MELREIGATYLGDGRTRFTVWAPQRKSVTLHILAPDEREVPMQQDEKGYWTVETEVAAGARYKYILYKKISRPDPASQWQPDGVHESSAVVDHQQFTWSEGKWHNLPLYQYILYELHAGTFTSDGTFAGIADKLPYLKKLGINAIELLPVAQFPGSRNWGYDGVYPFAVQDSYGGPEELKKLVNACHQNGIGVVMDVVYNHLGPEGNYLNDYGPYFTDKYHTPWGKALNFDDAYSDEVRNFFIQNALMWFRDYHLDALRLDAVHAIMDESAYPFLEQLKDEVQKLSEQLEKPLYLIAESDLNDVKIINDQSKGGYGHDSQWMDDFHHAMHALLTGEDRGYYEDFGQAKHLVKCYNKGFIYNNIYSPFRKRTFGSDSSENPTSQFVVCIQNHDQVGNRMLGERLSSLISFEALKLAATAYILSPYQPMLFMGEEWGEEHPFLYFISHGDKDLVAAVQKGRKEEFKAFAWQGEPPDPQSEETFQRSKLNWKFKDDPEKNALFQYYQQLIQLRKRHTVYQSDNIKREANILSENIILLSLQNKGTKLAVLLNFSEEDYKLSDAFAQNNILLDSSEEHWQGRGRIDNILPKKSAIVFEPK